MQFAATGDDCPFAWKGAQCQRLAFSSVLRGEFQRTFQAVRALVQIYGRLLSLCLACTLLRHLYGTQRSIGCADIGIVAAGGNVIRILG